MDGQQLMRITITLPEPLLGDAKRRAAERGVTLSVLLEDALRQHLAHGSTKPRRPFRLHTLHGQLVQPNLDLYRTSALIIADDEAVFSRRKR